MTHEHAFKNIGEAEDAAFYECYCGAEMREPRKAWMRLPAIEVNQEPKA